MTKSLLASIRETLTDMDLTESPKHKIEYFIFSTCFCGVPFKSLNTHKHAKKLPLHADRGMTSAAQRQSALYQADVLIYHYYHSTRLCLKLLKKKKSRNVTPPSSCYSHSLLALTNRGPLWQSLLRGPRPSWQRKHVIGYGPVLE